MRSCGSSGVATLTVLVLGLAAVKAAEVTPPDSRTSVPSDTAQKKAEGKPRGLVKNYPATSQWVDLIPRLNLAKDAVAGQWRADHGGLAVAAGDGVARLVIPLCPRGSYDLDIRFTRTAGDGPIGVNLPVGQRLCTAVINARGAGGAGAANGLELVNGSRADRNSTTFPGAINTGRAYVMNISVRLDGDQATITVNVDDRPWMFYRGPASALAFHNDWKIPRPTSLGVVAACNVQFSSLRLKNVSGEIRSLRP